MADKVLQNLLLHVRSLVGGRREAGLPSHELLARFQRSRDEAAFAALVERHGPMVLGVCRRILRQEQDAEDAFQATFLTLARKAHAIRQRGIARQLAAWRGLPPGS